MVDAHWAHADLALAEERFVQHARFKQHLGRRVVARYPDVFDEIAPLDELADEELKQLKDLFGPYGEKSWTALSMHKRIAAIETQFDEASTNRRQLRAQYEIGNAANNAELHPSPWSLGRAMRVPARGGEMLQFCVERESELTPEALRQTWWILTQLLGLMHIESALSIDRLSKAADAGADFVAAAQAAGPPTGLT